MDLGDPVPWRDMLGLLNFHAQYNVPKNALYPWDLWEKYDRNFDSVNEDFSRAETFSVDESRLFLYEFLKNFMNKKGVDGEACIQRAFCENAQIDHHDGLYADILDTLLTPGKIDDPYEDAYNAGTAGVDCNKLFKECPRGDSIFDQIALDERQ